jgi:hypothetical protein
MIPISRLLIVTERLLPKTESMSLKNDFLAKSVGNIISIFATKLEELFANHTSPNLYLKSENPN